MYSIKPEPTTTKDRGTQQDPSTKDKRKKNKPPRLKLRIGDFSNSPGDFGLPRESDPKSTPLSTTVTDDARGTQTINIGDRHGIFYDGKKVRKKSDTE